MTLKIKRERKKRNKLKGGHKNLVVMVFCGKCWHWFVDSVDWKLAKERNIDSAFVCPFCRTKLWLK